MKENSKLKKIIRLIVALVVIAAISLVLWKTRHIFNFSEFSFDKFSRSPKKERDIYGAYSVKMEKAAGGVYYVRLSDVVCEGSKDYSGSPHFFRMTITFEADNKETAKILEKNGKELVAILRNITKDLRLHGRNGEKLMNHIKAKIKSRTEEFVGIGNVKGIYFESFLGQ